MQREYIEDMGKKEEVNVRGKSVETVNSEWEEGNTKEREKKRVKRKKKEKKKTN